MTFWRLILGLSTDVAWPVLQQHPSGVLTLSPDPLLCDVARGCVLLAATHIFRVFYAVMPEVGAGFRPV